MGILMCNSKFNELNQLILLYIYLLFKNDTRIYLRYFILKYYLLLSNVIVNYVSPQAAYTVYHCFKKNCNVTPDDLILFLLE